MSPEELKAIEGISEACLNLSPEERPSYITEASDGNKTVQTAVESRVNKYYRARQYFAGLSERLGFEGLGDPRFQIHEGLSFGTYVIDHEVGQGGMGIVYKATDTERQRDVALKFLLPRFADDERARMRFAREAVIMESIQHNNLPDIYEVLEYNGLAVIVMEFIDGVTLKELLKQGSLPADTVIDYATQIAHGLQGVHEAGIMHRDLKPANIMISNEGVVKILDFGLARFKEASSFTRTGATLGTIAYMSPEQASNKKVDQRTDIWSMGVILYEMMTGQLPFNGDNDPSILFSILNEAPDLSRSAVGDTPGYVLRILRKMLSKEVDHRFQRVHEITEAFAHPQKALRIPLTPRSSLARLLYPLAAVILILLGVQWLLPVIQKPEPGLALTVRSVAILPFSTTTPDLNPLANGMAAVWANQLGFLDSLKVIAPPSAMRFREQSASMADIETMLRTEGYITGQLEATKDSLFINFELVDATTGITIHEGVLSNSKEQLGALQYETALALSEALGIPHELTNQTLDQPRVNNAAYLAYLESFHGFIRIHLSSIGDGSDFYQADSLMTRAIELDSTFADALGWYAQYQLVLATFQGSLKPGISPFIERALQQDPDNRYALLARAMYILYAEWNWEEAERIALGVIARYPQDFMANAFLSSLYLGSNRHIEGFDYTYKSFDQDFLATWPVMNMMMQWMYAGQFAEAIARSEELIRFDENDPFPHGFIGKAAYLRGQDSLALAHFDTFTEMMGSPGILMSVNYLKLGRKDIFDKMHSRLLASQHPRSLHYQYLALRDTANTLHWLEKDVHQNPINYLHVLRHNYDVLLKDQPRFRALLRKANMEPFVYRRDMIAPSL